MSLVMASLKNLLLSLLRGFIHKDFHDIFERMTLLDKLFFLIVHFVDKLNLWHRLPVFLGLLYLGARRHLHQEYNLINVGKTPIGVRSNPADHPYRTADDREEKHLTLDSARKSFSQALKECQDRRSKARKKLDRQKPDLNNAIIKATHANWSHEENKCYCIWSLYVS